MMSAKIYFNQIIFNLGISIIFSLVILYDYKSYIAPLKDKYHTFWPRFWAPTIDVLVLWIPTSLIPYLFIKLLNFNANRILLVCYVAFFLNYLYSIYFHWVNGATIGKITTKVKVVDAITEGPITMRQAIVRDLIPIIFAVILLVYRFFYNSGNDSSVLIFSSTLGLIHIVWYVAEILTMLTNQRRRAVHDFIAGTVVIRTNIE